MRRSPTFRLIVLASLLAIAGAAGCARHNPSGQASAERDRFAAMFARGYVPGRSGQLQAGLPVTRKLAHPPPLHRAMTRSN